MNYADLLNALFFAPLLVLVSYFLSPTAFSPLQEAESYDAMARPRFDLFDLGVLVIQIQLGAALLISASPTDDGKGVAMTWLVVPLVLWWIGGVRLLACARIERRWHRVFFLSLVGPLGYLMALMLCCLALLCMYFVFAVCTAIVLHDLSAFGGVLALASILSCVAGVLWLIRATCRMLVTA